jgi:hypothetical protein
MISGDLIVGPHFDLLHMMFVSVVEYWGNIAGGS